MQSTSPSPFPVGPGLPFSALSGPISHSGRPNISTFDFTGLTGLNFVTGAAGLYFLFYTGAIQFYLWLNTGTETDPGVGGTGIQCGCFATDTAGMLASEAASIINLSVGAAFIATASGNVLTITTTADVACTASNAGTSGVVVETTQTGQASS